MASDSALFIGWKLPVVGREADAVELFGSFVGYLGKQQASGAIESLPHSNPNEMASSELRSMSTKMRFQRDVLDRTRRQR